MMKKLFAMLLCVAMLTPFAVLAGETDKLILGTNASFPPFEEIGDDGTPIGFDIALGQLVADKLGKTLLIEDMSFDGLLLALESGKIDMIAAAMTITPERQAQADFSEPYFYAQQSIIVRKDYTEIGSLDDLHDKKVVVQEGTTGHEMATNEEKLALPADQVTPFKNAGEAVLELKAGRADCMIIDASPATVFVSKNDDLMILEGIEGISEEHYGLAVKKGNDKVLTAINEVLAEIMADGTYDELIAKYFSE